MCLALDRARVRSNEVLGSIAPTSCELPLSGLGAVAQEDFGYFVQSRLDAKVDSAPVVGPNLLRICTMFKEELDDFEDAPSLGRTRDLKLVDEMMKKRITPRLDYIWPVPSLEQ